MTGLRRTKSAQDSALHLLIAAIAKAHAVTAVSVRSLQAEKALLQSPGTGDTLEIDDRLLQLGDAFVIATHSTMSIDSKVIKDTSAINKSMITRESIPVPKAVRDNVVVGTINRSSTLIVYLKYLPLRIVSQTF